MKTILLIDDENTLRESIIQLLGFTGYIGIGAENGSVGLQMAQTERPDLIICDIDLPDISGFDVIQAIRNNPVTADIPFIFLTAKADLLDIERGSELGANAYVTKPFVVAKLLAAINSCFK